MVFPSGAILSPRTSGATAHEPALPGPGDFRPGPRPFRLGAPGATPWAETPAAGDTRGRGRAAARSLPGSVPEKPSLGVKHLPGVAQALSVNGNQPGQKWGSVPAEREGARNPGIVGERGGSQEGCGDSGVYCRRTGVKGTWDYFVLLVQLF